MKCTKTESKHRVPTTSCSRRTHDCVTAKAEKKEESCSKTQTPLLPTSIIKHGGESGDAPSGAILSSLVPPTSSVCNGTDKRVGSSLLS
eukprot:CAMPEP_0171312320 /NCGR_PEP_ID=MMETSP0816-20121228/22597_1 /TAXON_ID=420281 /ORGANISM="Proboscia inermis, Strain CCAP1064/1" /LENGTH=88 /DNA_ID=CAMNT_0011797637 /DNA_START=431 /DNA_END=694 /DNA_ORIENTATION=-